MRKSLEPYFEAKNLRKSWNSPEYSLQVDFSLQLAAGEMVALLGPSGCGKSTVLRLIAGLLESEPISRGPGSPAGGFPAEGEKSETRLRLEGRDLLSVPAGRRQIGMVFQNPSLFPHLRTDDNVAYGLRCQGVGKKEARKEAMALLESFGLGAFAQRRPESLSGGEAQRVSLARTLIVRPKLILFDEPLSAVDAPLRRRLAQDICRMQDEFGFAGIFVTHDREEAQLVADRIITMEQGRVVGELRLD